MSSNGKRLPLQRMRLLACALLAVSFSFVTRINCLDSENNEPIYKFTEVSGAPDSLNGSTGSFAVSDFSECIAKCSEDVECVLVHQESSDAPCLLFPWGSVTGVRNNASGGEGQVAFKVFTDQPACDLNAHYLLNGKTYPLMSNDTEKYLWRIDTSETGWTITYLPCEDDNKCGQWGPLRPYPDSCNNECLLTMLQLYAEPGNIKRSVWNSSTEESWFDCMIVCYADFNCSMVHYTESDKLCNRYTYGALNVLAKTAPEEGSRMAIKAPLSNVTCSWSTEQLLQDTYFMPLERMPTLFPREYFRVQNMAKFYLVMYYRDDSQVYDNQFPSCPTNFKGIGSTDHTVCEQPFRATNISQPEAKEICEAMGGHLIVEINWNATSRITGGSILFNLGMADGRIWEMGDIDDQRFWVGLEKTEDCSKSQNQTLCTEYNQWEWAEPEWIHLWHTKDINDTKMPMTWSAGEPSTAPNKTCGYMQMGKQMFNLFPEPAITRPRTYSFVAADCESRDVDGFICGVYQQNVTGVRKYESVAAEYGMELEPCCSYDWRLMRVLKQWPEDFVPMRNETKDEL